MSDQILMFQKKEFDDIDSIAETRDDRQSRDAVSHGLFKLILRGTWPRLEDLADKGPQHPG
jgi:hypothetical protein